MNASTPTGAALVKTRPILFSAPMVRALLDGSKTQTRSIAALTDSGRVRAVGSHRNWHVDDPHAVRACPYGAPGDLLWVTQASDASRATRFEDRFWERVIKFDDCWEWFGQVNKKRYGVIRSGKKSLSVHRVSWEIHNGSIPDGMHVLHRCDLPWCVNPAHLWLGTNKDNIADKMAKGRHRSPCGEDQRASRLTWQQIENIRSLYWEQDFCQKDIAAMIGIHQSQVSKIVNSKQWREPGLPQPAIGHRTLRITDVRVQRLQDITDADAVAEGVEPFGNGCGAIERDKGKSYTTLRGAFALLWMDVNGPGSWESNPFVWALTFDVLRGNVDEWAPA